MVNNMCAGSLFTARFQGPRTQSSLGCATWQVPSESHSAVTSPPGALCRPLFLSLSLPELTEPVTWFILVLMVSAKGPCPIRPESVDTGERPLQVFKIYFLLLFDKYFLKLLRKVLEGVSMWTFPLDRQGPCLPQELGRGAQAGQFFSP